MTMKTTRTGARTSRVKGSNTQLAQKTAHRSGTKASSIKKLGSALSATRNQHGGRRKPV